MPSLGHGRTLKTKGLFRLQQFSEVEFFSITAQETGRESEEMLSDMVALQKEVLSSLGLHYRYASDHSLSMCVCACTCVCEWVNRHMSITYLCYSTLN